MSETPKEASDQGELRPCPFCNQELLSKDLGDGEIEFYHNMDCILPPVTTVSPTEYKKDWDDAYCWKEIDHWKELARELLEYAVHDGKCILTRWESGEPTPDGGYRSQFAGKWYQTRPINETPKCGCGLAELIERAEKELEGTKKPSA